nr:unnamed protein product [Callosobruchus analis]
MLLGRLNTSIRTAFEIEHSKINSPATKFNRILKQSLSCFRVSQITPNTSYSQNLQQTSNSHPNFRKQQNYNQYQKHPTQSYVSNIDQNKQSSQNTRFIKNKSHSFNSYSTPNSQIAPTHIQIVLMLTVKETSTPQYSISVDYAIRIHIPILRNAICL